ncbi:MAG: hypothetical protein IKR18_01290 [Bacteroidaceae bacterium]|nr:hypothetical protein [Bacteroidaceae bacterium]
MVNNAKTRSKVPSVEPRRHERMVCLVSEHEAAIVDAYLKKYNISNKGRWMREVILGFIQQNIDIDHPTLFNENEMRR